MVVNNQRANHQMLFLRSIAPVHIVFCLQKQNQAYPRVSKEVLVELYQIGLNDTILPNRLTHEASFIDRTKPEVRLGHNFMHVKSMAYNYSSH